jgi:hypothetical protein
VAKCLHDKLKFENSFQKQKIWPSPIFPFYFYFLFWRGEGHFVIMADLHLKNRILILNFLYQDDLCQKIIFSPLIKTIFQIF